MPTKFTGTMSLEMIGRFGGWRYTQMPTSMTQGSWIFSRKHLFVETDLESDRELDGWIESFCKPDVPNHRNARLALLLFHSVEVYENRRTQDELLYALIEYFQDYCHKITCFFDLKNWLSNLELEGQTVLLQRATATAQAKNPIPGSSAVSIVKF